MLDKFNILFFGNVFSSLFSSSFKKSPPSIRKKTITQKLQSSDDLSYSKKNWDICTRHYQYTKLSAHEYLLKCTYIYSSLIRERKYRWTQIMNDDDHTYIERSHMSLALSHSHHDINLFFSLQLFMVKVSNDFFAESPFLTKKL